LTLAIVTDSPPPFIQSKMVARWIPDSRANLATDHPGRCVIRLRYAPQSLSSPEPSFIGTPYRPVSCGSAGASVAYCRLRGATPRLPSLAGSTYEYRWYFLAIRLDLPHPNGRNSTLSGDVRCVAWRRWLACACDCDDFRRCHDDQERRTGSAASVRSRRSGCQEGCPQRSGAGRPARHPSVHHVPAQVR